MDPSKPGKGILASLEHKAAEPPRRSALSAPPAGRGAALVVGAGVLIGALLAWWLNSGPSPVIMQETLPPFVQAGPPSLDPTPPVVGKAAAIVDDAALPELARLPAAAPALAVVPAPAPIAKAVIRHGRAAAAPPSARPKPKAKQIATSGEQVRRVPRVTPRVTPRMAPDTDVALLSALVAHANEHDVIEPRSGDSTASLLQRCRRVGGEEGRLCRIRICTARMVDHACNIN